jgi:hypothetical protein
MGFSGKYLIAEVFRDAERRTPGTGTAVHVLYTIIPQGHSYKSMTTKQIKVEEELHQTAILH